MMFKHCPVDLPKLQTKNIDGKRFYETPEKNYYPSITTVLSIRSKQGLSEWRKRVGNDVANYISRNAAARGTKVHQMCEDYLNNQPLEFPDKWEEHKKDFLPWCLFVQLQNKVLDNIGKIYAQECSLYSDKYKVAGRVDCIAEYKGILSIIDFKTSTKLRLDEWNENYYIQASAYSEMFHERTGLSTSQVVILVVSEDGTVQEFIKNKHNYLNDLSEAIEEWSTQNV